VEYEHTYYQVHIKQDTRITTATTPRRFSPAPWRRRVDVVGAGLVVEPAQHDGGRDALPGGHRLRVRHGFAGDPASGMLPEVAEHLGREGGSRFLVQPPAVVEDEGAVWVGEYFRVLVDPVGESDVSRSRRDVC
jgi:hypothetical protein